MDNRDEEKVQGGSTSTEETDTLSGGEYSQQLDGATQSADEEVSEPDDRFDGGVGDGEGTAAEADERFGDPGPGAAAAGGGQMGSASGLQPETQGEDPVIAELGEDGEGDLAPEDV